MRSALGIVVAASLAFVGARAACTPAPAAKPAAGMVREGAREGSPVVSREADLLSRTRAAAAFESTAPAGTRQPPRGFMDCPLDGPCGECSKNADCGDDAACSPDWRTRKNACFRSTCERDEDCAATERCLPISATEDGVAVTTCAPIGTQREGESCDEARRSPEEGCAAGLVCLRGTCQIDCTGKPDACASGFECIASYDGWACDRVSCANVKCAEGFECRQGVCTSGVDCTRLDACEPGQVCQTIGFDQRWVSACYDRCTAEEPCGGGRSCHPYLGICVQRCDRRDPDACPTGFSCSSYDDADDWGCLPRTQY